MQSFYFILFSSRIILVLSVLFCENVPTLSLYH